MGKYYHHPAIETKGIKSEMNQHTASTTISKIITLMLYGHLRYHSPFVAGCLLWMRTKATWQKGHSLLPLAVELEPLEVAFMVLRLHFPDMASKLGAAIEPSLQSTRCCRSQVVVPNCSAVGCDVDSGRGMDVG